MNKPTAAAYEAVRNPPARGWSRLVEHYEGWRYRRTYGRNADHSRALAAARAALAAPRCPDCEQDCSRVENHLLGCPWPVGEEACHCGQPVHVHEFPEGFTRGLCQRCDAVRCDAYPGACR